MPPCNDGILNQNEIKVDCGGVCSKCMDYYVSNSGNDSNNGSNSKFPWKTLEKVDAEILNGTISSGDTVGFRAGDTFVGTLNTSGKDGTSGNPIAFTSYGLGDKATFSGLVTLNNSWEYIGNNTWRYNVSGLPTNHIRYLLLNGVNQKMAQSEVYYADNATANYVVDSNLSGGLSNDYINSEIILRTTSYNWEIRNVTDYNFSTGNISFSPSTYGLWSGGGADKGYFFQNSLYVLQNNSVQNEWAHQGNFLYYYSISNPYTLGTIKVSSIDNLVDIRNSNYISLGNIGFEYSNERCVFNGNSDYMILNDSYFDHCVFAIHDDNLSSNYEIINNNTITNSGSGAIYQYYPINITLTNNHINDTGLEIGKMPFLGRLQMYWGYNAIFVSMNGGLAEYNNVINVGYLGMALGDPNNHALAQYNYVKNPLKTLHEGGAFYVYSNADPTSSNIDKITFRRNIAVFDDYASTNYKIGAPNLVWYSNGFHKDGYVRAINYYDNFAAGFYYGFYSHPTSYSVWEGNIAVSGPHIFESTGPNSYRAFGLSDATANSVFLTNNTFNNNTFVSNSGGNYGAGAVYEDQLNATSGNVFDYDRMLNPFSNVGWIMVIRNISLYYVNISEWKSKPAVGIHETSDLFLYNMSGLSNSSEFVWYDVNPTKGVVLVNFPAGYRYYTVGGDEVTNDTLGVYEGKVYYRTIDEGMPQATNVSISGNSSVGDNQTGLYLYSHEEGNSESGSVYRWYRSSDGTIEARVPISGANNLTYQTTASDQGQYIIFGVKPEAAPSQGNLLEGVERFSSPKLIS